MTAEIAILNSSAIALAADSAVTVGSSRKTYNTALKLFVLSKRHPVGAMIYGSSEFMDVPWETIIKEYRKRLKDNSFSTLEEYGKDLMRFVGSLTKVFIDDDLRLGFMHQQISNIAGKDIKRFSKAVRDKAFEHIRTQGPPDDAVLEAFEKRYLEVRHKRLEEMKSPSPITLEDLTLAFPDHGKFIDGLIDQQIDLPIQVSKENKALLRELVVLNILKNWHNISGVVIAGFGENDVFPCYVEFITEAIYGKTLKCAVRNSKTNGMLASSEIVPFAQTKLVERFIEGIDPDYQHEIDVMLDSILSQYPKSLLKAIPGISDEVKTNLQDVLKKIGDEELEKQKKRLEDYRNKRFVDPIIENLQNLPKEELAAMAEALVNITMFKQKISLDESETVGGAIDVAVISKGDGFIWIKRKHYFDPKLNPHFFSNNYPISEVHNDSTKP